MSRDGSVAPKERINIRYVPSTGDAQDDVELPLSMMVVGDFTARADDTPIEERTPININKNNFNWRPRLRDPLARGSDASASTDSDGFRKQSFYGYCCFMVHGLWFMVHY